MNKRIRELAEQATEKQTSYDGLFVREVFDKEKFAELIIKECVDAAEEAQADFYVVHNIKSRFGLAELKNERTNQRNC